MAPGADGTVCDLEIRGAGIALRGAEVELRHRLCDTMRAHCKDRVLPVTAFRPCRVPEPAGDEKTTDLRVDRIVADRRTAALAALEIGRG